MTIKKTVEYEIDETPVGEKIDENGEFVFYLYTSNLCDDDFSDAIVEISSLWETAPENLDIPLKINVRLKSILEDMLEMYSFPDGSVDEKDLPLFQALRKDCQLIINEIDALKFEKLEEST